jgi:hypothetical protein
VPVGEARINTLEVRASLCAGKGAIDGQPEEMITHCGHSSMAIRHRDAILKIADGLARRRLPRPGGRRRKSTGLVTRVSTVQQKGELARGRSFWRRARGRWSASFPLPLETDPPASRTARVAGEWIRLPGLPVRNGLASLIFSMEQHADDELLPPRRARRVYGDRPCWQPGAAHLKDHEVALLW